MTHNPPPSSPTPTSRSTASIVQAVAWIILAVGLAGLLIGIVLAIFRPGKTLLGVESLLIAGFGGLYVAVGVALLWFLRRQHQTPNAPPVHDSPSQPVSAVEPESPALTTLPSLADMLPPKTVALHGDDFTMIEGIGLKVQDVLYQAGITTYTQLAEIEVESLLALFRGIRRLPIVESTAITWPRQAQYIVDQDFTGLESFQASLPKSRS